MTHHLGQPFSALDADNSVGQCVAGCQGGWWYGHCCYANLNGVYGRSTPYAQFFVWYLGDSFAILQTSTMMIRPGAA